MNAGQAMAQAHITVQPGSVEHSAVLALATDGETLRAHLGPEEVALLVVWLSSASGLTGEALETAYQRAWAWRAAS
ncbi:hypothetical protein SAMN06264364_1496 [Quadrisphaera granulorum]|uniref:Uncharacterized protein n=1 Tax=Quadrisphaera granulorum TaxID=317664 RepID=A0A315ZMQ7_9ACTN|nr:hypothetical protein [Quadrisphaera granulorum]PWJ46270.1 hypothetical protein BXY45_1496 [Quadrisphaera granulorum]SZE99085.1 hypothetical protein SAMN06264364_1496 [Quadrisphaera granulorum]